MAPIKQKVYTTLVSCNVELVNTEYIRTWHQRANYVGADYVVGGCNLIPGHIKSESLKSDLHDMHRYLCMLDMARVERAVCIGETFTRRVGYPHLVAP